MRARAATICFGKFIFIQTLIVLMSRVIQIFIVGWFFAGCCTLPFDSDRNNQNVGGYKQELRGRVSGSRDGAVYGLESLPSEIYEHMVSLKKSGDPLFEHYVSDLLVVYHEGWVENITKVIRL